jgi:hypothetical protein
MSISPFPARIEIGRTKPENLFFNYTGKGEALLGEDV